MATNQSGACRWCSTSDITIRRNLIRNAGAGINLVPRYNSDSVTSRVLISENVLDNIGVSPYVGDQRGFQLLPKTSHVTIERTVLSGKLAAALVLEGGEPGTFRNNVWVRGMYGVIGASKSPGTPTISYYAPNATWSNMTFVGTSNGPYPPGTRWIGAESGAPLAAQIRAAVRTAAAGVVVP
jgi:hypothetical protein